MDLDVPCFQIHGTSFRAIIFCYPGSYQCRVFWQCLQVLTGKVTSYINNFVGKKPPHALYLKVAGMKAIYDVDRSPVVLTINGKKILIDKNDTPSLVVEEPEQPVVPPVETIPTPTSLVAELSAVVDTEARARARAESFASFLKGPPFSKKRKISSDDDDDATSTVHIARPVVPEESEPYQPVVVSAPVVVVQTAAPVGTEVSPEAEPPTKRRRTGLGGEATSSVCDPRASVNRSGGGLGVPMSRSEFFRGAPPPDPRQRPEFEDLGELVGNFIEGRAKSVKWWDDEVSKLKEKIEPKRKKLADLENELADLKNELSGDENLLVAKVEWLNRISDELKRAQKMKEIADE